MQTNKKLVSLMAIVAMCTTVYAQKGEGKVLVAYFSATGTTEDVAEKIAAVTGGELHEIAPEQAYTNADLDWNNRQSRSSVEMNDPKSRPALKEKKTNMADYDVVYIGFPIWWGVAPHIVNTFIESHDLKGKTLIPFATSGGIGISQAVAALRKAYPELNCQDGKLLNRADERTIRAWIEK